MKLKFWGVRGSIPCPGPHTMKYGGNTACIELRFKKNNRLIIIDAGSGIRELGNYLTKYDLPNGPLNFEIFLTHTHWDHIMGFPFFAPMYIPNTKIKIYGPVSYGDDTLEDIVGGLLTYRYFPIRQKELLSEIEYIDLKEGRFDLGDGLMVTTKYLNHPILCLGYRFEYRNKQFCTLYDTEPFRNVFSTDIGAPDYDPMMALEGDRVAKEENQRVENFYADADIVVVDAQYTMEEYEPAKVGWGHMAMEDALEMAKRARVKKLVFFHHEPTRTDDEIDTLSQKFCSKEMAGDIDLLFARDGMEMTL